jgi:hypothetical protein
MLVAFLLSVLMLGIAIMVIIGTLSTVMLNIDMLSGIMLSVIMASVAAPVHWF